jgi:hypothetical protein
LLVLVEPIELELLEGLVVDDRVVSAYGITVTESTDVVQKGVEEVVLEVDAVADEVVAAGRGDITCRVQMSMLRRSDSENDLPSNRPCRAIPPATGPSILPGGAGMSGAE